MQGSEAPSGAPTAAPTAEHDQPGRRTLGDEEFSAAVAAVTSAFGDPTRRDIYLFTRESQGVTAGQVASHFDLHPNVARHHLDKLAAGGYLEVFVERSGSAGAGRPSKRYRASAKDMALEFPARRDDLLVLLLGRALSLLSPEAAECMAETVGEEYGAALAAQMAPGDGQRSLHAAIRTVADALTAHGFAAHAEARGTSVSVVAEHCPFGETAAQHPIICAVDRGMVRGLLAGLYGDSTPVVISSRARGDDTCVTAISGAAPWTVLESAMSRHYLDHASTSPCRPEVVEAMLPWLAGEGAADPGRVHTEGRIARVAVEDARAQVAEMLGTRPRQVVFTSGGTEAINAAVWAAVQARPGGAVVSTAVEHSAVRDASSRHAEVVEADVDELGRIDVGSFRSALDRAAATGTPAALAHCQLGNHEVATLQPVTEIVAMCRERGVLVHVDAAAAAGHLPLDLARLEADLVSVSAHKLGGPKGAGALVVGRGLRLDPLILGGEQERARRGGIENTPAMVGFGTAARLLGEGRLDEERSRAWSQTDRVLDLARDLDGVTIYGDPVARLPHIACLGVAGVEAEAVLLGLDQDGVAVHSGSACSSESLAPSPVLQAMGADAERSLRVSVGWSTTDADIDALVDALPRVVERLRALRV